MKTLPDYIVTELDDMCRRISATFSPTISPVAVATANARFNDAGWAEYAMLRVGRQCIIEDGYDVFSDRGSFTRQVAGAGPDMACLKGVLDDFRKAEVFECLSGMFGGSDGVAALMRASVSWQHRDSVFCLMYFGSNEPVDESMYIQSSEGEWRYIAVGDFEDYSRLKRSIEEAHPDLDAILDSDDILDAILEAAGVVRNHG